MHTNCKAIFLFLALPVFNVSAYSQQAAFEQDMSNSMRVFDANGKIFVNPNTDVAGSPYFIDDWKYGILTLSNNAVYSKRLLRLDFESQEIHYISDNNIEMTLLPGLVKEMTLTDSVKIPPQQYQFRSGFPQIDKQDKNFFYRILSDGKLKMLQSTRKKIITEKDELSGEIKKEYRAYNDYYFFSDDKMTRIGKDKSFFTEFMKNKIQEIEQFLSSHKISFKSVDDIKILVDYYNGLF